MPSLPSLAKPRVAAPASARRYGRHTTSPRAFLGPISLPPKPAKALDEAKGSSADEPFKRSVDVMLNRAASSLARGPCTCLSCRGVGAVSCPHCKGAGLLSHDASEKANMLRGALLKLRAAMGLVREIPYATSQWVRTNRCMRCHGAGHLPCDHCSGSGLRYPYLTKDHWRQCAGQPGGDPCADPEASCRMD